MKKILFVIILVSIYFIFSGCKGVKCRVGTMERNGVCVAEAKDPDTVLGVQEPGGLDSND